MTSYTTLRWGKREKINDGMVGRVKIVVKGFGIRQRRRISLKGGGNGAEEVPKYLPVR